MSHLHPVKPPPVGNLYFGFFFHFLKTISRYIYKPLPVSSVNDGILHTLFPTLLFLVNTIAQRPLPINRQRVDTSLFRERVIVDPASPLLII